MYENISYNQKKIQRIMKSQSTQTFIVLQIEQKQLH